MKNGKCNIFENGKKWNIENEKWRILEKQHDNFVNESLKGNGEF